MEGSDIPKIEYDLRIIMNNAERYIAKDGTTRYIDVLKISEIHAKIDQSNAPSATQGTRKQQSEIIGINIAWCSGALLHSGELWRGLIQFVVQW